MSEPIWGNDRDHRPPSLPPGAEAQEGFGSTVKFVLTIALVLALIVGAAYLFVVFFPDIGLLGAPPTATPSLSSPTPTFTPFPTPSPTAQQTASPTPQASPSPTVQPSPSPSPQPSPTPTPQPSPTP